jgi:transcriptional regulator with XRE-family HTH domain
MNSKGNNGQNLGKNIRYLRKLKGWTQKELAAKLGCSQAVVAAYEHNRRLPLTDKIILMTQLFGVSYDQLFGTKNAIKTAPTKSGKLWKRFEQAENLPPHDKTVLIKMIDGLLEQQKHRSR